ncbi:MAG: sugar phosphate nucleotidyltransferase [Promethearchaeota archaeon]
MIDIKKSDIPVVILAAGDAKRLEPLSNQINKPMVPIAGIPMIIRIILGYNRDGFTKFLIVIGDKEKKIKDTILKLNAVRNKEISVEFIIQKDPKGMADAIYQSFDSLKPLLKSSKFTDNKAQIKPFFIVSAADVLFNKNILSEMLQKHSDSFADITLSLIFSEDNRMSKGHGNVLMDENGIVLNIIEKPGPEKKISDYYSMPVYIFSEEIMEYIREIKKSERQEIEIQDAIKNMITDGKKIVGLDIFPQFKGKFSLDNIGAYHITYIKDFLAMNFRFLEECNLKSEGEYPTSIEPVGSEGIVKTGGAVMLGPNVYIGKNSEIGDFTEISDSILLGNNKIGEKVIIENSIIGPDVEVLSGQNLKNCLLLNDKSKENKVISI